MTQMGAYKCAVPTARVRISRQKIKEEYWKSAFNSIKKFQDKNDTDESLRNQAEMKWM